MTTSLLIIEDSRLERSILESIARKHFPDCRIDLAGDSLKAEALVRSQDYDHISVDINIPGIDGLTLIPTLRQKCPRAAIAVVSAGGRVREIREEIDALGVAFVPKPVVEEDFLAFLTSDSG